MLEKAYETELFVFSLPRTPSNYCNLFACLFLIIIIY